MQRAELELDIYDVLDPNFTTSVKLFEMRERFKDLNAAQIVFSPLGAPISAASACKIQDFFRNFANQDARIQSWVSPWKLRAPKTTGEKLWYPTVLEDPCSLPGDHSISTDLAKLTETPWKSLLTDRKFQDFSVNIHFKDEESSVGKKHFDVRAMSDLDQKLGSFMATELPQVGYEVSGQAAFRWHFKKILSKDAVFNLAILVLFFIFFRIFYGTWKSGAIYIGTLLFTIFGLYGLLSWLGIPIDMLTNNLFLMTAIAGAADFLFVTSVQEDHSWEESFRKVMVPGFFTSFTTFIGFWSLLISDLTIIQRFGFAAGCGTVLEWVATFWILPAVLKSFNYRGKWVDINRAWRPAILSKSVHLRPGKKITILISVVLLGSLWAGTHLNFSDTPTRNFPESHPLRKAFLHLLQKRGWESSVYIIFKPAATREQQREILTEIGRHPQVLGIESALEFENFLTQKLTETQKHLVLRELSGTPFYQRYWLPDGTSRSMILMRSSSLDDLNELSGSITTLCGSLCSPVGQNEVFREYSTKISSTLAESFLLSIVLVLLCILGISKYRKMNSFFALAVSVLWGPLIMILFLWAFQIPINIVTSVFLAVIVGMTGDNGIQYLFGGDSLKAGIEHRGLASILLSILLCLSSLSFLGQTLLPVRTLGILFFFGFLSTLIGDLWILQGLLAMKKPTREVESDSIPLSDRP